jgi:hypothetical protein
MNSNSTGFAVALVLILGIPGLCAAQVVSSQPANEKDPASIDAVAPDVLIPPLSELQVFPPNNPWNTDISNYPVHPNSANFIASIGTGTGMHPDFGTFWEGAPNGIPWVVVGPNQPMVPIEFTAYGDQSDPGPYPIPPDAPIEGGPDSDGDRHVLVIDPVNKVLYEMFYAFPIDGGESWECASGAVFDLTSNELRPDYWTSADAAGLPIFPGLVTYEECVIEGEIDHALRFTCESTQRGFIHPATHYASDSNNANLPPMGLRVRLKAGVNENKFPARIRPIVRALKKYGMFVADNGSDWYLSGAPDPRWDDDELHTLGQLKGSDFEAVDTGPIIK